MAIERRHFVGVSQIQLEQWLRWVNEELATGKTRQSWGAGDSTSAHWIDTNLPATTRRDMILNDLAIVAPNDYDADANRPIKRTRVRYI